MRRPLSITDKLILSALLPTEASRRRLLRIVKEQAAGVDWEQLGERGRYLLILPLLRYNLARADALPLVPPGFQELLREVAESWAARELGAVSEARRLVVLLQAHGIQAIPLKGTALMLGGYYPQPGLRPALDIDLVLSQRHDYCPVEKAVSDLEMPSCYADAMDKLGLPYPRASNSQYFYGCPILP